MTIAEIVAGIARAPQPALRAERERWLHDDVRPRYHGRTLALDEAVLIAWQDLRWSCRRRGRPMDDPDALIAATARVHKMTLVTRNTNHFAVADIPLVNPWLG